MISAAFVVDVAVDPDVAVLTAIFAVRSKGL